MRVLKKSKCSLFPEPPKAIVKPVTTDIDKSMLIMDLESRWQQLVPKPRPKPPNIPNTNTKVIPKQKQIQKRKTTDDINAVHK